MFWTVDNVYAKNRSVFIGIYKTKKLFGGILDNPFYWKYFALHMSVYK